jgi:N,N-dimethylformamidase
MLVGYVSDERYVAIADVAIEIDRDGETVAVTHSTARGKVLAEIEPGRYRVTLAKQGFGSKSVTIDIDGETPYQFRLLSDGLLGYVWPKWVQTGERSEFRVHAVEPYRLSLWRYGRHKELQRILGWFDEHGPRAVMQITPDGDYTQTGVKWNSQGYGSAHHTQFVTGPERSGLYYLEAETENGSEFFSFPWIVAPKEPTAKIAVVAATNDWNAYNNFGGRSNYVNATGLPPEPVVNATSPSPSSGPTGKTASRKGPRSPTRSAAAAPAARRRPSGGCSAGWSRKAFHTISTASTNFTAACSISTPTRC